MRERNAREPERAAKRSTAWEALVHTDSSPKMLPGSQTMHLSTISQGKRREDKTGSGDDEQFSTDNDDI